MKIVVYGSGCAKCGQSEKNVEQAVRELGLQDVKIVANHDQFEMLKKGITNTPAVTINDELKCLGRIPEVDEIKTWLS